MHLVYGLLHLCGGTFSENFALPFICVGMYLYTKYILKDKVITNKNIIIFGILTGLIAQLRLNMLGIFLAMFVTIGILLLSKKEYKDIFRWISFGIIGFLISIIPSLIYLINNNVLVECINIAYLDILSGFNIGSMSQRLSALKIMIDTTNISQSTLIIFEFILISFVLIDIKKISKKEIKLYITAIILSILINIYANSVSGAVHMHYFITFIPILVMVIGFAIKLFDKINLKYIDKIFILTVTVLMITFDSYMLCRQYIKFFATPIDENDAYVKITEYITSNTEKEDLVQFIGGREEAVSANFRSKRLSASKYSYLPLWSTFTKERKAIITNEVIEDIKNNTPKLIFVCLDNVEEFNDLINNKKEWDNFLEKNYSKDEKTIENYYIYSKIES